MDLVQVGRDGAARTVLSNTPGPDIGAMLILDPKNAENGAASHDKHPRLPMHLPEDMSAPGDFDFIIGDWNVLHRRLRSRLSGCSDWAEFEGLSSTRKILGGLGNVEDNVLRFPDGEVRAAAFRSFDPAARKWSIWWLDGSNPHRLDAPVIGEFTENTGTFFADDFLQGAPIKVRFTWNKNPGTHPTWEQAFSPDVGRTWETNWTMAFKRAKA